MYYLKLCIVLMGMLPLVASAEITIKMYLLNGDKTEYIGDVVAENTQHGLLFTPDLHGLTPGMHGFHIHEYPSCSKAGMDAGGHFDPGQTEQHLGPYNDAGHLGDLPPLWVNQQGEATLSVLAPRLKEEDIHGHALMIHVGGENYSDHPQPLGGGGARMACGIIE